jgi:uncharacterized protein YggE
MHIRQMQRKLINIFPLETYMSLVRLSILSIFGIATGAFAGVTLAQTADVHEHEHVKGTVITVPASGEVTHANDEARITLSIEEQDKDKATAASRVNLKMKQGTDLVKQDDPSAILKTRGYYTYPVYANETSSSANNNKLKQPIGWRVGQYLDVTTSNLVELPKLVADAQQTMSLNGVHFGLARATAKKLDQEQIDAAYQNLTDRIAFIAKAMGKNANDATLESISFDPTAGSTPINYPRPNVMMARAAAPVEEPSLEPGETTQELHIVGMVIFK